jgi:hypothetical protein
MVLDEQPTGFKNVGFLKNSQLHTPGKISWHMLTGAIA